MLANFPEGLLQSEEDKCFGISMLIYPCVRESTHNWQYLVLFAHLLVAHQSQKRRMGGGGVAGVGGL
jgi:hypothetical protein